MRRLPTARDCKYLADAVSARSSGMCAGCADVAGGGGEHHGRNPQAGTAASSG